MVKNQKLARLPSNDHISIGIHQKGGSNAKIWRFYNDLII